MRLDKLKAVARMLEKKESKNKIEKKEPDKLDKNIDKLVKSPSEKKEIPLSTSPPKLSMIIKKISTTLKSKKVKKKGKEKTKEERKGLKIPEVAVGKIEKKKLKEVDLTKVNLYYPLIPRNPRRGETVYAYAHIKWDDVKKVLIYEVVEPVLSREEKMLLDKIRETLEDRLEVNLTRLKTERARKYLDEKFNEVLDFLGIKLGDKKWKKFLYYMYRDYIGLGKIEPLMHDPYLEDISCDGVGIPIYVYHRNPFFGSIETNIVFETKEELDTFVMKLAQKGEKSISMAEPLLDASLPDGSRIQITFGTDIAKRGSNFTIRKFVERPLTPIDLINFGTVDSRMLAYLWYCIEHGKSILVSGGTATGKTTFLNVLSMFIKPNMKIVSIEDTPELRFSHPHWISEVARQPISDVSGKKFGQVDLYDLLRASLRQRPDYLIVGEVRGKEAYVLFQQMVTGHPGLSTIHADSIEKLVDRLTTEPINLPPSLIENLDIIVFLRRVKIGKAYLRRVSDLLEVERYDRKRNKIITNEVFKWVPETDSYTSPSGSIILKRLSESMGIDEKEISEEIMNRTKVLEWMRKKGISDYREFGKIIRMYYANSKELFEMVG